MELHAAPDRGPPGGVDLVPRAEEAARDRDRVVAGVERQQRAQRIIIWPIQFGVHHSAATESLSGWIKGIACMHR